MVLSMNVIHLALTYSEEYIKAVQGEPLCLRTTEVLTYFLQLEQDRQFTYM